MKKLVKKDKNGRLQEIDKKALNREALALKKYIEHAPADEVQQFSYSAKLIPVVDAAIGGSLEIPFTDSPYNLHLIIEDIEQDLPNGIQELYFQFMNRIQGSPALSSMSVIEHGHHIPGACEEIINGERFEWVMFED